MQERVKKKLLITASTFPRFRGDTEPRFILDLAKELQKYFDVTVLAPASPDAAPAEELEGITVERYRYFPLRRLETLCYPGAIVPRIREKKARILLVPFLFTGLYIALFRRRKQYDYVHAHWLIPQGIVQSIFQIPYIVTGHGGDVTSLNGGIFRLLKRHAVEKAAAVTVVSRAMKDELLSLFPEASRERISAKLFVQPMGCDTERFRNTHSCDAEPLPGNSRQAFKASPGSTAAAHMTKPRKTVLFVGRLAEKKGVKYLIEAMQWIDAELLIAGDGPLREALVQETARLKLTDKVRFLGAMSHEELPRVYASADIFAAPSVTARDQDKEGFGLVILEAMASGLPVVASRSGGITDLIQDGWNGLLAEEKDSRDLAVNINRLFTEPELYSKLVENMKDTVQKYSYTQVGKAYAEIIRSSMASRTDR